MQQFRQGDVFVEQVRKRARKGKAVIDRGRVILAYGEVTGHAHEVVEAVHAAARESASAVAYQAHESTETAMPPAQLFEEPDGTRYLFVDRACLLTHQEHGTIALAPGCYKVTRQREYSPEEIRNVAD